MKLISVDGKWHLTTSDSTDVPAPVVPSFNRAINEGLPANKYVCMADENHNDFTVMNFTSAGLLEDNFTIRIIKLPNPDTEPFIVLYKISDQTLVERFHNWLVTFHPEAKIVESPESFLTPPAIQKIISQF